MEASLRRRVARAPPPTPIATGKGRRTAAVDDRVLSEYLESSLRIPYLNLPKPDPVKSPIPKTLTKVDFSSIRAGDDVSVSEMMAAIKEMGAFLIEAGDLVGASEARALIEAGGEVFGTGEVTELILEDDVSDEAYQIFR